jgi:ribosomal protein S18 acetylase RimI-like enzyme
VIEELLTRDHDRKSFNCGTSEINEFLRRYARQNAAMGVAQTFVLVAPHQPRTILGYYSLSSAQIDFERISEDHRRRLPKYPVPAARMGRLGVDHRHHGQGIGSRLLGLAIRRCQAIRKEIGLVVLVVDAKDQTAASFYQHHGFTPVEDDPLTLYLPLELLE